jgi:glycosyltransferase involved in cell wall biosynthesis/peptidoglycan/xylan/chitin deacetylase (PgdA/CDA1 family)
LNTKALVFVNLSYVPLIGGVEKQMQSLAEEWVRQGRTVWVLTKRVPGHPREEIINGVRVFRLPVLWAPVFSWITFGLGALVFLFRHQSAIDCIIGQMLNVATLPVALFSSLTATPFLVKISAGGKDGNIQGLERSVFGHLKLGFLLKSVDYAVAMNEEIVQELKTHHVPPFKIRVIPNGVDVEKFKPLSEVERREIRKSLGFSDEETLVLFVGRLEPVKNIDFFLTVWKKVHSDFPNSRFLIVGEGRQKAFLESKTGQLGLSETVRFLGAQASVLRFYQAADLLVLPSLREGISNALLEAMACGLTPLASAVGGNVDVLKDLEAATLLPPTDESAWLEALRRGLKDTSARKILGVRSRGLIEKRFSMARTSAAYLNLYQTVQKPFFRKDFPILAYHRVCRQPSYGIDLSVEQFEQQIRWLSEKKYHSITLARLRGSIEKNEPWPEKGVVITFDDGHREVYEQALPILQRYGFTATLFLNPGLMGKRWWVGGRRPHPVVWHDAQPTDFNESSDVWRVYDLMSWEQALELYHRGFEIGSHAFTHPFLTQLTDAELTDQLVKSKQQLEEKMHSPIPFFCYPSGDFDERVKKAVLEAGYQAAVYSPDHYDVGSYWDDAAAWERIGLWRDVAFWKFKALVEGWYPRVYRRIPLSLWKWIRALYRLASASKD